MLTLLAIGLIFIGYLALAGIMERVFGEDESWIEELAGQKKNT